MDSVSESEVLLDIAQEARELLDDVSVKAGVLIDSIDQWLGSLEGIQLPPGPLLDVWVLTDDGRGALQAARALISLALAKVPKGETP